MKTYTYTDTFTISNPFCTSTINTKTNYSKILDNIILANIAKNNPYLFKNKEADLIDAIIKDTNNKESINSTSLKDSIKFAEAAAFLANYGKKNYKLPYSYGTMYYINGHSIIFHFDSIEIDGTEYYYDDFNDIKFINKLSKNTEKLIITIYINSGANINISIK